jgi:hydrogenase/urease accessory protein HupE
LAARSLPAVTWPGVAEAALVLIFGLAVAAAWAPPAPILFALVASLGLIFGYLQAVDLDLAVSPLAFAGGLALGVGVLVLYGTALVARLRAPWANIGARVVGSWIAAINALVLALAFR